MRVVMRAPLLALLHVLVLSCSSAHAREPLQLVYYETYFPFSYVDDDGDVRGLLVDIMNEAVGNRMGVALTHQGLPWKRAQLNVKLGRADAFVTGPTEERRSYTEISREPVVVEKDVLFTWAGNPRMDALRRVRSVADLEPFEIITYLGNGWAEQNLGDMTVRWVAKQRTVLEMLAQGRADVTIESATITRAALRDLGLANRVVEVPETVITEYAYHLCIGRESPHVGMLEEFDRVMRELRRDGTLERIQARYR